MSSTDIQPLDAADYPDLSERQLEALPIIFAAPTLKAGLEAADIPKSTWYRWVKQERAFAEVVRILRTQAFGEAMEDVRRAARYAAQTLLSLLTSKSESIRLQAAREILSAAFRATEVLDQEERLQRLEEVTDILLPRDGR
ncbi:MAG: hypothetical protein H6716_24655 [Polyangiaceae bacterium]|nr:hypothetical protein [Polyangiaceae bacterium]